MENEVAREEAGRAQRSDDATHTQPSHEMPAHGQPMDEDRGDNGNNALRGIAEDLNLDLSIDTFGIGGGAGTGGEGDPAVDDRVANLQPADARSTVASTSMLLQTTDRLQQTPELLLLSAAAAVVGGGSPALHATMNPSGQTGNIFSSSFSVDDPISMISFPPMPSPPLNMLPQNPTTLHDIISSRYNPFPSLAKNQFPSAPASLSLVKTRDIRTAASTSGGPKRKRDDLADHEGAAVADPDLNHDSVAGHHHFSSSLHLLDASRLSFTGGGLADVPDDISVLDDCNVETENITLDAECHRFYEVTNDGETVRYTGMAAHSDDVAVVRATRPFQPKEFVGYFEMTVVNAGSRDASTSIGLSNYLVPSNRHPGSYVSSFGYSNDGMKKCEGISHSYGPKFAAGDTVGCGQNFSTGTVFFTLNGRHLGDAFTGVFQSLLPTVGLHGRSVVVNVNLGKHPFRFEKDDFVNARKTANMEKISAISIQPSEIQDLVRDYLIHNGYEDTYRSFTSKMGKRISANGDNAILMETLPIRKAVRMHIVNSRIVQAIDTINSNFPDFFTGLPRDRNHHYARVLLACEEFIELSRQRGAEAVAQGSDRVPVKRRKVKTVGALGSVLVDHSAEIVMAADEESLEYLKDILGPLHRHVLNGPDERQYIEDVASLIAYNNPLLSPHNYLLTSEHRKSVADVLNYMVLGYAGYPSFLLTKLDILLRQLVQVRSVHCSNLADDTNAMAASISSLLDGPPSGAGRSGNGTTPPTPQSTSTSSQTSALSRMFIGRRFGYRSASRLALTTTGDESGAIGIRTFDTSATERAASSPGRTLRRDVHFLDLNRRERSEPRVGGGVGVTVGTSAQVGGGLAAGESWGRSLSTLTSSSSSSSSSSGATAAGLEDADRTGDPTALVPTTQMRSEAEDSAAAAAETWRASMSAILSRRMPYQPTAEVVGDVNADPLRGREARGAASVEGSGRHEPTFIAVRPQASSSASALGLRDLLTELV